MGIPAGRPGCQVHPAPLSVDPPYGRFARKPEVHSASEITVTFNPVLNGATIGLLQSIVLPDKKEVEFVPN